MIGDIPVPIGITGGIMKDMFGYHPYIGGGLTTPGPGLSFQSGDGIVTDGWNAGLQYGGIVTRQDGINESGTFSEMRFRTPGVGLTGYYVW